MSSAQCLRRLSAAPHSRPASLRRLYSTSPRCISRLTSASKVANASYSRCAPSSLFVQRKPLYSLESRQFSLSSRNNEEQRVKTPEMAESITEGTLKSWNKSVGDYVEQDEELGSIETDKIDVAINSPAAGTIKEFLVNPEDTVEVGQEILVLTLGGEPGQKSESSGKQESEEKPKEKPKETEQKSSEPQQSKEESKPAAPPQEHKHTEQPKQKEVDKAPSQAPPKKQESKPSSPPKKESSSESHGASSSSSPYGNREERRVKMNRMRLRIAERLKQSQNTAASLTTFNEVDMSSLMNMRKAYKDEILKKTGVKFGFMGAFAMASVLAMKSVPTVNASIEGPGGGDTIVYRDYVDISVAVATEKGLVTPVVRNAESLDIVGIEKEISDLGKKARDNKLTIEDMAGGTFTISNGGVFGSLMGTPIINLPQTAVLGLHAIKDKPVAIDGKVEIRPMMYLALTYDHRLLDGREAVTFLVKIKEYIEDPRKMLLPLP